MNIHQKSSSVNPARRAFSGSSAHPYIQQLHLAQKPRHLKVRDDAYLAIIENGRKIPVLLETHLKGIKVTINHEREQLFSLNALTQPTRILDYLGLQDDNNHVFTKMCQAFHEAHHLPTPQSPAQAVAADLKVTLANGNGKLAARLDRALALVEQEVTEFPHYNTRVDLGTMNRACDCPDHAPFTSIGKSCKHTLAQHIAYLIQTDAERTAHRKLNDQVERLHEREIEALRNGDDQAADQALRQRWAVAKNDFRERQRAEYERQKAARQPNGNGHQTDPELIEIAQHDPALAKRLAQRDAAYAAALRPDRINRHQPNRNLNIERR